MGLKKFGFLRRLMKQIKGMMGVCKKDGLNPIYLCHHNFINVILEIIMEKSL